MGALFSSPVKAEEKDELCEECKKEPDKFKPEYSRLRDDTGECDPKTRRNGASNRAPRVLGFLHKIRNKDKPEAVTPTETSHTSQLFIRR